MKVLFNQIRIWWLEKQIIGCAMSSEEVYKHIQTLRTELEYYYDMRKDLEARLIEAKYG